MNIIRNPKNKFGNMLLNIVTTVILPEVINRVSDTLIKNVMEPKKEERKYFPKTNCSYSDNNYEREIEQQMPKNNNVNINLNITTTNSEDKNIRKNHYIIPNIYVPMYIENDNDSNSF